MKEGERKIIKFPGTERLTPTQEDQDKKATLEAELAKFQTEVTGAITTHYKNLAQAYEAYIQKTGEPLINEERYNEYRQKQLKGRPIKNTIHLVASFSQEEIKIFEAWNDFRKIWKTYVTQIVGARNFWNGRFVNLEVRLSQRKSSYPRAFKRLRDNILALKILGNFENQVVRLALDTIAEFIALTGFNNEK